MKFETNRLIIRPLKLNDKILIFNNQSDKKTNQFQDWVLDTIKDVENFIKNTSTKFDEPNTWFYFVIIEKESEKIIGDLGIHFFDKDNKEVELECTLDKYFHNKGYATESLIYAINYKKIILLRVY